MGHEIVYCFRCSNRIAGVDADQGAAVQIGNRTCCSKCLPIVLAELPEAQRETLLAELRRLTDSGPRPPSRNTPRGGTEISSSRTPRAVPIVPPDPDAAMSPTVKMALIGGVLVVLALLLLWLGGGTREEPVGGRGDGPVPPPPIPKPEVPGRDKIARDAVLKARDAARSGIDIDLQVRLWEDAVAKAERTPLSEEATQEHAAMLARRKEVYAQELTKLLDNVDVVVKDGEFKKALDILSSARRRRDTPEWGPAIDRKIEDVRKAEAAGGPIRQGADADGLLSIEAERYHRKTDLGDHAWTPVTVPAGFSGPGAMSALPNKGTGFLKDFEAGSPRMEYRVEFLKPGKYFVWVRACGPGGADDSLHVGLDGKEAVKASNITFGGNNKWNWGNKTMGGGSPFMDVTTAGPHTVTVYMREDGAILDKLVLTLNSKYVPKDAGPPESPR